MRFFFFLLFLSNSIGLWAQSEDYRLGAPYHVIDAPYKTYLTDTASQTLVAVKENFRRFSKNNKIYLQTFDLKTLEERTNIQTKPFSNSADIIQLFLFHGRIYVMYRDRTREKKDRRIFVQEIDPQTGDFKDEAFRIIGNEDLGDISAQTSTDGKQLIIQGLKILDAEDDNIQVAYYVFGKDFKKQSTIVELPYTYKRASIRDYHVGEDGTPYLLLKVYPEDTKRKKDLVRKEKKGSHRQGKMVNYHIEMLRIDPTTGTFTTHKIDLEDKLPIDYVLAAGPNKQVVCGGYYTLPDSKRQGADGLFMVRMDDNGAFLSSLYYEIPLDILAQYETSSTQRIQAKNEQKDNAEMFDLRMTLLKFQPDGSILINGEVQFSRTYTVSNSNGGYSTRTVYYYQDILVSKIDPKGQLAWINKLPKHQAGNQVRGGMGHRYFGDQGIHYYLYLDHKDNEKMGKFDAPKLHKDGRGGILMVSVVHDKTGEVAKKAIINISRNDSPYRFYQFRTSRIQPVGDRKAVIEFYVKKKRDVLMEITLPN